ncbi:helix-turn-helix domain-containing protein [Chitinophaga agrisoli]|uniref:Helix-turn-helix domain-containing protein n=1 Tax=Chitinophaga agrisoli TaxID=2607653 RepID=A0A5B2VWU4_9BACT|nr:helix-turn-helix domain-containing protein [Chitinophaga agrisoli]KAA2242782.1 helix-turn-helix domain-containing protein [Chitinophaga agrisoli]
MQKKHVAILALKNANYAAIADARSVFEKANDFCKAKYDQDYFDVQIIAEQPELTIERGLVTIRADATVADHVPADLIIIPALRGDLLSSNHLNRYFVDWIIKKYRQNCEIASLCTGAFMLAFTGLLKGKKCTTHWSYANEFRFYFPDVTLVDEKMIVEHNGIYSSGGSNAYWNLLLFLVEKYTDRETAILVAKHFVVDLDRNTQTPFIIFNGLRTHQDAEILKAQDFIEENYRTKVTVENLADSFHLTRRTFERRFKKATHCTVIEYLQKVRIEASKKALEAGRKPIEKIMSDVGYADMQTFRQLFKEITGLTPLQYRERYN